MHLTDFTTLSFDCYGTLIDWETGLLTALRPLQSAAGLGDEQLLEAYSYIEHALEEEQPGLQYSALLTRVYERLAETFGLPADAAAAHAFGNSVGDWPAFPDSAAALAYLKQHFRLVILSNVDRASFAHSNERLRVEFDDVFTAEEIGSYKPDPRNFQFLLDQLADRRVAKGQLLHVAQSLFHDHVPANAFGIASAWIDRRADKPGGGATVVPDPMPHFDFRFNSLGALAEAHRAEIG